MGLGFEIKKYAVLAAGFILSKLAENDLKSINTVFLFGSAARGTASETSDIDLFFDTDISLSAQKSLKAKLNASAAEFYLSNAALEYKLRGISNEISITVGGLSEWDELSRSIASEGITLYGKCAPMPAKLAAYVILSWEKPGKAKGAVLNKLYGYKSGGKAYKGMLNKSSGIKLGRGTIMVPAASRDAFISVFEKYKINYSRRDVWG